MRRVAKYLLLFTMLLQLGATVLLPLTTLAMPNDLVVVCGDKSVIYGIPNTAYGNTYCGSNNRGGAKVFYTVPATGATSESVTAICNNSSADLLANSAALASACTGVKNGIFVAFKTLSGFIVEVNLTPRFVVQVCGDGTRVKAPFADLYNPAKACGSHGAGAAFSGSSMLVVGCANGDTYGLSESPSAGPIISVVAGKACALSGSTWNRNPAATINITGLVPKPDTATWVDGATIKYKGLTYHYKEIYDEDTSTLCSIGSAGTTNCGTTVLAFQSTDDPDGCQNQIRSIDTKPGVDPFGVDAIADQNYGIRTGANSQDVWYKDSVPDANVGCKTGDHWDLTTDDTGKEKQFFWDAHEATSVNGRIYQALTAKDPAYNASQLIFKEPVGGGACSDTLTINRALYKPGAQTTKATLRVARGEGADWLGAGATDSAYTNNLESKYRLQGSGTDGASLAIVGQRVINYNGGNSVDNKCVASSDIEVTIYGPAPAEADLTAYSASNTAEDKVNDPDACDISGALGWIVCPVIIAGRWAFNELNAAVISFLNFGALTKTEQPGAYYIWQTTRNLTNGGLVIVFLIIIFSNTLSIGLDSYAIKKMLPRLIVAAIVIQFSWLIMQLLVDITNIIGGGIPDLINFATAGKLGAVNPSGVSTGLLRNLGFGAGGVVVGIGIALGFVVPLLLLLLSAVLGILGVFVTLAIRKFLIIALVAVAPVAILLGVLPNTEGIFAKWWRSLLRLLLMYPIIQFMFSMAQIANLLTTAQRTTAGSADLVLFNSKAAGEVVNAGATSGSMLVTRMFSLLLPIIVFYMVPSVWKWAGGAMSAAGGFITGRASKWGKGARNSQLAKDSRQNRLEEASLKYAEGKRFGLKRATARLSAGAIFPTSASSKRLLAGGAAAMEKRKKERGALVRNMTGAELKESAMGNGRGKDPATQMAALERMAALNSWDDIRQVQEANPNNPVFKQFIDANAATVNSKAKDVMEMHSAVQKGSRITREEAITRAVDGMSADDFVGQHASLIGTAGHLGGTAAASVVAKHGQVMGSPVLATKFTGAANAQLTWLHAAAAARAAGTPIPPRP